MGDTNWFSPFSGGMFAGGFGVSIILFLVWSLVWKGLALWKSAQRGERGWFLAFLLLNTIGILEILYLYIFSKKEKRIAPSEPKNER